jgi:DNA-binding transcriptional MerR regulator
VKYPLGQKLYFSISEVAELTDLQPYVLRTWEKEFSCLRPRRLHGKNRAYRQRDINLILLIKRLLHEERFTVQGVRQKLKNDAELIKKAIGQDEADLPESLPPSPVLPEQPAPPEPPPKTPQVIEQVKAELRAILQLLA